MVPFVQKLLRISMRFDKSRYFFLRIAGKILGIFPVWYCRRMEKRLFNGKWDPLRKFRKKR